MSASIENPPQPTTETEILGPTYSWSGETASLKLTSYTGSSVGLQTTLPPKYGGSAPAYEGTVGDNSTTVTCRVTYTSRNKNTGVETPLSPFLGSKPVNYFIRTPMRVVSTSLPVSPYHDEGTTVTRNNVVLPGLWWGYRDVYHLKVIDQRGANYGAGTAKEKFVEPKNDPLNLLPEESSWSGALIEDTLGVWTDYDPGYVDPDAFAYSTDQEWHYMEDVPPYPSTTQADKKLNTHSIIKTWASSGRTIK